MEKVNTREIKSEEIVHEFYCDECGEKVDESIEDKDCFYTRKGSFYLNFRVNETFLVKEACYCDKCREKQIEKIVDTLEQLGFERR